MLQSGVRLIALQHNIAKEISTMSDLLFCFARRSVSVKAAEVRVEIKRDESETRHKLSAWNRNQEEETKLITHSISCIFTINQARYCKLCTFSMTQLSYLNE